MQAQSFFKTWPAQDRTLLASASRKTSLLDEGGRASAWRPTTLTAAIYSYNRWLKHLRDHGELSHDESPAARITKARIERYMAYLRGTSADATISIHLHRLYCMVRAMCPKCREVAWLGRLARRLMTEATPARPKAGRTVDISVLFNLGLRLMKDAGIQPAARTSSAVQYRDGLMIAMLACRVQRLGELMALRINETIRREGVRYVADLPSATTKSKRRHDVSYPEVLTPLIDIYIDQVREKLSRVGRERIGKTNDFWLSRRGRAMTRNHVSHRISQLTLLHVNRNISPHLFRHCGATSTAIKDPEHVGIVKDLLHHKSLRTGEKHYNLANAVPALRRFHGAVAAVREELAAPTKKV